MKLIVITVILVAVYIIQREIYNTYWNRKLTTSLKFSKEYLECGEKAKLDGYYTKKLKKGGFKGKIYRK